MLNRDVAHRVPIGLRVRRIRARLAEELLHPRGVEGQDATPRGVAYVDPGVHDAGWDVDGLPGPEPLGHPIDRHLELALDHVDRLGRVLMYVRRQRPTGMRMIDEEAEGATGVIAAEVNLGADPAGHPDDLRLGGHGRSVEGWGGEGGARG